MKLIPLLLVFAVIGFLGKDFYEFLYDPGSPIVQNVAEVVRLEALVKTKKGKLTEAEIFTKNLDKKREELRELSKRLLDMKATLSETLDLPAIMKLLFNESQRIGIMLNSLTPKPSIKREYYIEQPFEVSFSGLYVQLLAFLDRISQSERVLRVDEFSVYPKGTSGIKSRFVDLQGTLLVKTYLYLGSKEDDLVKGESAQAPVKEADKS